MSCNYADGLSKYAHKGILGIAEKFDSSESVKEKCAVLAQMIKNAKHVVVHTGAGISTSAGIPDFRGPNGVWTLQEKGLKPDMNISFMDARPTKTHMAIKKLLDEGLIHYVVSQNIDGLHLRSGVPRSHLSEVHGNMFVEQCNICKKQFIRSQPAETVGQKSLGFPCYMEKSSGRPCRGKLHDVILDWEHNLPEEDLEMGDMHSCIADLSICFGTTLQIIPSGNLPLNTLKYSGKLVICNLQPTKHDNKADLVINSYVDDVLQNVMDILGFQIPEYSKANDPTCFSVDSDIQDWTLLKEYVNKTKAVFKKQCDGVRRKRVMVKRSKEEIEVVPNKKIKEDATPVKEIKAVVKNDCDSIGDEDSLVKSEDKKVDIVKDEVVKTENGGAIEINDELKAEDGVSENCDIIKDSRLEKNVCDNGFKEEKLEVVNKSEINEVDEKLKEMEEGSREVSEESAMNCVDGSVVKQHEGVVKEHEVVVKEHEAVVKEHEDAVKEHETVVQEHESVVKEHEDAVQQHESVVKEHEDAVQQHEAVVKEHEIVLKGDEDEQGIVENQFENNIMDEKLTESEECSEIIAMTENDPSVIVTNEDNLNTEK